MTTAFRSIDPSNQTRTPRTAAFACLVVLFAVALPMSAQQHDPSMHEQHMRQLSGGESGSSEDASSPYVDLTERAIKALSAEEIEGLRAGEGMGFALAAELNGYPGPKHVLELADDLMLSADQRASTQRVFDDMAASAQRLGEQLVDAEARLDRSFVDGSIDAERLGQLTSAAARARGELRAAHLSAHLAMMDVLSDEQVRRYAELRGYRR